MAENSSDFETMPQGATASTAKPGIFCTRCGYHNPPGRGACLMCLNLLLDDSHGANCPACRERNPGGSRFCAKCGSLIDSTAVAVFSRADLALRVLDAVGDAGLDVAGGEEGYADEDSYIGEAADAYDEEEGAFEEYEEYAEPVEGAKPAGVEVPQESIPGPMLEAPDPAPAADEIAPDEDFFASAPSVVDTAEDDFAPPPPPGAVAADEDDFAPPPPPGAVAADDDDFAPPPPPGALELDEDDFAPPPPPGALELDEDEFAPPPPPSFDTLDDDLPPPPPPSEPELPPVETAPAEEVDFGGWELEADEEEEDDENK